MVDTEKEKDVAQLAKYTFNGMKSFVLVVKTEQE